MGLEALSRGAETAWFIEKDADACRILKENCTRLDPSRCHIFCGDAFEQLDRILDAIDNEKKAYLYVDPPFVIRKGHEEIYDRLVRHLSSLPDGPVDTIIVEHMTAIDFPDRLGPFVREKKRRFGKSSISYYEK